jgi:uncharacterized protein YggU (UPF0235/DUF167 family)
MSGSDDGQAARFPFAAITDTGVRIAVRLTPRAARDGLDGVARAALAAGGAALRVAAPPVEGAANAALVAYVAESLGLRRSDVAIVSGERGPREAPRTVGDPAALLARLADWVAERRRP